MQFFAKTFAVGLALVTAATGSLTTAPAQARTETYVSVAYHDSYYRGGYRDRDGYRDRGDYRDRDRRHWNRRDRREYRSWRGRDRCWTEWRWSRHNGRTPVRVCR